MPVDFIKSQSTLDASKNGAKMLLRDVATNEVMKAKLKGDTAEREMFLTLLGPESYKVRQALVEANARATSGKDSDVTEDDHSALIASDAKMLADITVGGEIVMNDKWVTVDQDIAFQIYFAVASARIQATNFAKNLGNFKAG